MIGTMVASVESARSIAVTVKLTWKLLHQYSGVAAINFLPRTASSVF
jgi:hypothetical protein